MRIAVQCIQPLDMVGTKGKKRYRHNTYITPQAATAAAAALLRHSQSGHTACGT